MAQVVVRVIPRSSRNSIDGPDADGIFHIHVTAPPSEGSANAAVTKLLASALEIPKSALILESGHNARLKRFSVPLDAAEMRDRLTAFAGNA